MTIKERTFDKKKKNSNVRPQRQVEMKMWALGESVKRVLRSASESPHVFFPPFVPENSRRAFMLANRGSCQPSVSNRADVQYPSTWTISALIHGSCIIFPLSRTPSPVSLPPPASVTDLCRRINAATCKHTDACVHTDVEAVRN